MTNDERDTMLRNISSLVGEIHTTVSINAETTKRHDKTLYGAERPGVVSTLQAVEDRQRSCPALQAAILAPDTKAERRSNRIALIGLVIFGVLNIGTLAIAIIALRK